MVKIQESVYRFGQSIIDFMLGSTWNGSIKETVHEFGELVSNAKDRVQIVAGDLEHSIFDDKGVLQEIETAIKREENPISVEILCGPHPDQETREIWKLADESGGLLRITKLPDRPNAHFVVVDGGKRIRIEEFHEANAPERLAYGKRNTLFLGSMLQDEFRILEGSAMPPKSRKKVQQRKGRFA